VTISS